MKIVLFYSIAVILLCSCNAIRKSQDANHLRKAKEQFAIHPKEFAGLVAVAYPLTPKVLIDTTPHINDSDYVKAMNGLNDYLEDQQHYYDSVINSVRSKTIYDTVGSGYCEKTVKDLFAIVTDQKITIVTLKARIAQIPPISQTIQRPVAVSDDAGSQVLRNDNAEKDKTIATATKNNEKLSSSLHSRNIESWIWRALCFLLICYIAGKWIIKLKSVKT